MNRCIASEPTSERFCNDNVNGGLQGKLRTIGVSNFGVAHLEKLMKTARVKPAVNQIELSPFLQRPELVAYCKQHDIALEVRKCIVESDPTCPCLASIHAKCLEAQMLRSFCASFKLPGSIASSAFSNSSILHTFHPVCATIDLPSSFRSAERHCQPLDISCLPKL